MKITEIINLAERIGKDYWEKAAKEFIIRKFKKDQICNVCLGINCHTCMECGEIISRKIYKKNGGWCKRCVEDCAERIL